MRIDLKVGDKVELLEGGFWGQGGYPPAGTVVNVLEVDSRGYATGDQGANSLTTGDGRTYSDYPIRKVEDGVFIDTEKMSEPTDLDGNLIVTTPTYYDFPNGVQVRDISAHLTSFGGQALQYVARATRLDGNNKGEAVKDLKKALDFIQWEIDRLEANDE